MQAADVPFSVNWFENPSTIAHALGVEIELPDVNNEDPAYWDRFDRGSWRQGLAGKVDMTADEIARGDPDWVRLKRMGGTIEIWFDLEEGIVFRCGASEVARVVSIIRQLAALDGLALRRGQISQVVARQTLAGAGIPYGEELGSFLAPVGLSWTGKAWTGMNWTLASHES